MASRYKVKVDDLIADAIQHRHRESIEAFEKLLGLEQFLKRSDLGDQRDYVIVEVENARVKYHQAIDAVVGAIVTGRAVKSRRSRGGHRAAQSRQWGASQLLLEIDQIRTRNPQLSDVAAARSYLATNDQAWHAGPDAERDQKVSALLRRIRRARKKQRTSAAANVRSIH